ncbi:MAG: fatty acid desaturase family protein [Enhygromyxa sp.]
MSGVARSGRRPGHPPGYEPITADELDDLTRPADGLAYAAIAWDYGWIIAAVCLSELLSGWLYPITVLLIGSRQQGLLVLMHEASHAKLLTDQAQNDRIGEFVLAWPLLFSMLAYRANHIAHHDHLNSADDPDWRRYRDPRSPEARDWRFPRPARETWRLLLRDLCGLNVIQQIARMRRLFRPRDHRSASDKLGACERVELPQRWRIARALVYVAILALAVVTGLWKPLIGYWIIPALTSLKALIRLRQLVGHFAVHGADGLRTTLCGPLERFLVAPHNIGFHTEHHLYPEVAWHRLPELHRRMRRRGDYRSGTPFRLCRGHLSSIADWSGTST